MLECKILKASEIGVTSRISAMRSTTYLVFSFEASAFSSFYLDISIGACFFLLVLYAGPSALNRLKVTREIGKFKASTKLITGEAFRKLQLLPRVNDL